MQSVEMSVVSIPPRRESHPHHAPPEQPAVTVSKDPPQLLRLKPNPAWWWGVGAVWFATILASWIAGIGDIKDRNTLPAAGSTAIAAVSRAVDTPAPARPVEESDQRRPAPAVNPARLSVPTAAGAAPASHPQDAAPVAPVTQSNPDSVASDTDAVWVINLVSLPDKAGADRFAAKVRSRNIPVRLQLVTVRGKEYWRIQTGRYASWKAARSNAEIIKDKLALEDVWIIKR